MDHLPLPVDKLGHPTLTIPYVCNERFSYNDCGFLTYPDRCGVDIWQLCSDDQIDSDAWAPFLQAWLWFGLLGETIGIGSRTHVAQRITSCASFIETTHDGARFVITKDLHKSIEAASAKNQAPLFSEFHRGRFDTCLAVTARAVKEILSTPSCRTRLAKMNKFADLPVLYPILLSVQILVETLCVSRTVLFPSQLLYTVPDLHPSSELVDYLLKESGWCPSQIPKLSKDVRVRYYLSYLSPFDAQEHKNCSRDKCRRRTVDEAQIQPLHTSVGCQCFSVSFPDSEVIRIVDDGDIPLVTFSEFAGGQRRLEIARYSRNHNESDQLLQFVAVSHVRQVGLGNQETHSLPYCQLSSLQMIADGLLGASANPTPFWIDTVCLPLRRDMKKRALREIHRVYRSAAKVVVLDPSLFQSSVGSAQDALFRIRYSLWKSRLWTLQEGILAKELHVRFRNKNIRLDELIKQHEASPQQLLATSPTLQGTDNNWLNSALACFDRDIKTAFKNGNSDVDPHRIRTILRLGYLASPLYRYFCEDLETENSTSVMGALLEVYSSLTTTEQCNEFVVESGTLGEAIERLRQMANIEIR